MSRLRSDPVPRSRAPLILGALALILLASMVLWPGVMRDMAGFVLWSFVVISPLVIPGILLAAWIIASGADSAVARVFGARPGRAVVAAAAIGAVTPVCGVTVLPLMAGLLAAGVPLAPVMAFWLSSPVTDPAMLATTAAMLGMSFAVGKTVGAFGLGLFGGAVTQAFSGRGWVSTPLRYNGIAAALVAGRSGCARPYRGAVWRDAERRAAFRDQAWATTRLMLICLTPAFAAEFLLNLWLDPDALVGVLGAQSVWAIPLSVTVGAPAYLDGYAALPLARGLMAHGMSPGAAMGFLVSGGVISIWGAMAILPVLRMKPFLLYLALAVIGSLLVAYAFEFAVA